MQDDYYPLWKSRAARILKRAGIDPAKLPDGFYQTAYISQTPPELLATEAENYQMICELDSLLLVEVK